MVKKYIKFILPLMVTLVAFICLFKKILFAQVFNSIGTANFKIILFVAMLSNFNGFFISSFRWKIILNKIGCDISWKEALIIKMGSDPVISMMPFKTGEIFRVLYLKRIKNVPGDKALFSIFIEYCLNMFSVLFFITLGIAIWLFQGSGIYLCNYPYLFFCFSNKKGQLFKNRWIGNLKERIRIFLVDLKIILDKKILFYSFLLILIEIVGVYFVAKSINIDIPLFAILIFVPVVILISSIPITFLGLGLRENSIVFLFLPYAPPEKLLALGIIYSFLEHILPMIVGLSLTHLFVNRIISSKK